MSPVIRITDELYERLASRAVGFDTPGEVIERLLDKDAGLSPGKNIGVRRATSKPQLVFVPEDEEIFKAGLIKNKEAEIALYKSDGTRNVFVWTASRFNENSNLRANLWSGYLRGWKKKGIVGAEISLFPTPSSADECAEIKQTRLLAPYVNLKFEELEQLDYEIGTNESNDGLVYNYIVTFSDDGPKEILEKMDLSSNNSVIVSVNIFDEPEDGHDQH